MEEHNALYCYDHYDSSALAPDGQASGSDWQRWQPWAVRREEVCETV